MRHKITILVYATLTAVAGCGGGSGDGGGGPAETLYVPWPTAAYSVIVEPDLVYGRGEINGGDEWQDLTLDLYKPDEWSPQPGKKFPLMLMVHGGGFASGSKESEDLVAYAREYAQRGWLVAAINYRLVDDDPIPSPRMQELYDYVGGEFIILFNRTVVAAIDDALTALEFLHARDDVYAPWTTLWGFSAGGLIVLNTAYVLDDHEIERPPVAAVVSLAGSFGSAEGGAYTNGTPFDDPTGTDPPLMLIHGTEDNSFDNAILIEALASAAGLQLDYQPVSDTGHSVDLFTRYADTGVTLFQRSVDYIREMVFPGYTPGPITN